MKNLTLLTTLCCLMFAFSATAQLKVPAASPASSIKQTVGLTDIEITYNRPSMKGRAIFGGLLQYDKMWRCGANASTKLTFSKDVSIEGNELKKGTYALYMIPGKEKWVVIIHKNLKHWGTGGKNYKEEEDAFRFSVMPTKLENTVETMTLAVTDITNNDANIEMTWENTSVKFKVDVNTDAAVTKNIDKVLAGPDAGTYYSAASYYLTAGKDLKKALEWINKSMEMGNGEKFWVVRRKALIEAGLGDYKAAVASAKTSLELAKKAGNDDYVRMNTKSIEEWSQK